MTLLDTVKMLSNTNDPLSITANAILESEQLNGIDYHDKNWMLGIANLNDNMVDNRAFEKIVSIWRYINSLDKQY